MSGTLHPRPTCDWPASGVCHSLRSLTKPWLLLSWVRITDYGSFCFFLHRKWAFLSLGEQVMTGWEGSVLLGTAQLPWLAKQHPRS